MCVNAIVVVNSNQQVSAMTYCHQFHQIVVDSPNLQHHDCRRFWHYVEPKSEAEVTNLQGPVPSASSKEEAQYVDFETSRNLLKTPKSLQ